MEISAAAAAAAATAAAANAVFVVIVADVRRPDEFVFEETRYFDGEREKEDEQDEDVGSSVVTASRLGVEREWRGNCLPPLEAKGD